MKFPRNAKIFRGQLDLAPFLGVFFLLVIFLLLGMLIYTPGVRIQLPESAAELTGTANPTLAVAVDAQGKYYFQNQIIRETELKARLAEAVRQSDDPLTLVVKADKSVSYDVLMRLTGLAREAGVKEALLAVLPRTFDASAPNRVVP